MLSKEDNKEERRCFSGDSRQKKVIRIYFSGRPFIPACAALNLAVLKTAKVGNTTLTIWTLSSSLALSPSSTCLFIVSSVHLFICHFTS